MRHSGVRSFSRRDILALAAGAGAAIAAGENAAAITVPFSAGSEAAKTKAPPNAADCHHHIYSSRFKVDPNSVLRPADASVEDYRLLQKRIGTSRNVIVQPSTYGIYNDGLVETLKAFGPSARGVAVVNTNVSDAELKALNEAGVRGIRFNILTPGGATSLDMVAPLSKRIAPMGWHIQVHASADMIAQNKDLWNSVPCDVVFDHLGHLQALGTSHAAFGVMTGLLQKGKGWVKLSGAYMDTKVGPPTYADSTSVAQAFVKEAPERLVWGSDWPHPTEKADNKPDDAILFDLLAVWAPDEKVRNRILVDNAAKLYHFG
ncbi:MAG TPA: amidohydrolase family protein [Hyphomicrobiales bacterium]|nr:amidohydrolase family protein [Hyphomicrobiales bacterium]